MGADGDFVVVVVVSWSCHCESELVRLCRRGNPEADIVFVVVVVVGLVALFKRHLSFWIATGLQRAPRKYGYCHD
jgi:hypothetical protein